MPSVAVTVEPAPAPAPPVLSNSTNSSLDVPSRKSNDKTIGGVFTYTNGTDIDTGLPEHRLDQFRSLKNASHSSLTNGIPAGSLKSRERAHSKAGSTHSIGTPRNSDHLARNPGSSDGLSKLSTVENASSGLPNGNPKDDYFHASPTKSNLSHAKSIDHDPYHMVTASSGPDPTPADSNLLSPASSRPLQSLSLNRFSSPPDMSVGASQQDKQKKSAEMPRLTQRHTLGVPRATAPPMRSSRDFSFSGGPSEEALYSTGRFSPTKDHHDNPVTRARRASLGLVRRTTRSMQSDAHLDDIPQDEDAARWTEVIRQKRASRRKRREEEDDDRVIVGKKVEEGHVNWVIAYNMLTGIRFTVSRTNAKVDRELTDADFTARHKFSFDVTGNELTPSAKYDFKFKDYAPWVFRHLRTIFGLDPADYLMSLTSKYILSELGSPGKSGSFFYFSRDYKYIIKTIHHAEHKLLRKILRDYYTHVVANPNTLISQIYGLHRVKIPYGRKIHFMVMNNLFPPHRDIHQTFDLKGSTIGRDFREEELAENPRATLKDLNWLRRDYHLEFDPTVKRLFLEQLQRDVSLLQRLHIMDYSLLVGIHDMAKGNEENLRGTTLQVFQPGGEREDEEFGAAMLTRTPSRLENARKARELRLTLKKERPVPIGVVSAKMPDEMESGDQRHDRMFYRDDGGIRATHENGTPGELIYYLGVIDCLTHYGFVKRLEHFWKGLRNNRTQISPIPPQAYGDRFINFVTGVTMTKEESDRRQTQESNRSQPMSQIVGGRSRQNSRPTPATNLGVDGTMTEQSDLSPPPGSPRAVEKTMKKAQKSTDKQTNAEKGRRRSEEEKPNRTLLTAETPSTLLPVVSEENVSGHGSVASQHNASDREEEEEEGRETKLPPPAQQQQPSNGIRMVSASTKRDSNEKTRDDHGIGDGEEGEEDEEQESVMDEKTSTAAGETKRFGPPPRLNSDLIPHMTPIYSHDSVLSKEPEKS